ncbi:MAG: Type 1 glutamine amidotransferase-like domain-containing protein [Candidatus Komeilibacteria bacterium]
MTKYILHGGYANRENPDNDKFYKEILNTDKKELSILIVLFAKPEEQQGDRKNKIIGLFEKNNKDKHLSYEVATQDGFINQLHKADIIFLHGGETLKLLDMLRKFDERYSLYKLFNNKIIAGESAGAYVLSKWFYSKTEGGCFAGLSLVDVKTLCHYEGMNEEKLKKCKASETLLLPEHKYKIFNL